MPRQLPLSIYGDDPDIVLEGIIEIPTVGVASFPAVAVCHPDPLMGGTMLSPVVEWVCRHLAEAGIATLRFNFRGIGESTGEFGGGQTGREDAKTAFRLLQEWPDVDPEKVGMAGYSFGGTMALLTGIAEPAVRGVAVISPPLGLLDYADMYAYRKPLLLIGGEKDLMTPGAKVTAVREKLSPLAETVAISGADRSWGGNEEQLALEVARFFKKVLRGQ